MESVQVRESGLCGQGIDRLPAVAMAKKHGVYARGDARDGVRGGVANEPGMRMRYVQIVENREQMDWIRFVGWC